MLIGLISDDDSSKYVDEIYKFSTYCKTNFLELTVRKTKEMIIDFRKFKALLDPIIVNDHTVEHVLGAMLNNDHVIVKHSLHYIQAEFTPLLSEKTENV